MALEQKASLYRQQNVQVLGISTADPKSTAQLAAKLGLSYPLVSDANGTISKALNLHDARKGVSAKAFAILDNGRLVSSVRVKNTQIPTRIAPWLDRL